MKKIFFFIFPIVLLFINSCSDESDDERNIGIKSNISPRSWEIAKPNNSYYSIGFSYDITEGYVNNDAVKLPVVNVDKFIENNSRKFLIDKASYGTTKLYAGASAEDFAKEVATGYKVADNASFPVKIVKIEANLKFDADMGNTYSYSSKYSYARIELLRILHKVKLTTTPAELQDYLEDTFIENLNNLSADQLISKYGTHVLLNLTVGGKLDFDYRGEFFSTTNTTEKKYLASTGAKASFLGFGGGSQYTVSSSEKETLTKKTGDWELLITYCGGNNSGVSNITFNPETGYPTTTFNPSAWEASVKEENAYLIDINWEEPYPIYEFIKDPIKKQAVKIAFNNYINRLNQIKNVKVVPLYRLYNNKEKNTFITENLEEAYYYINNLGYSFDYGASSNSHILGYAFVERRGTLLKRLYNKSLKNSIICVGADAGLYRKEGYQYDLGTPERTSDLGYVGFNQEISKWIPIYRLYNNKEKNTFYTTDLNEANHYIRNKGYTYDYGIRTNSNIVGYVLPALKK